MFAEGWQAYVHNYMTAMVSQCHYHADCSGHTVKHTYTHTHTPESPGSLSCLFNPFSPPFLSVYPLFSLSIYSVFPVDRTLSMLTQLELFAFPFLYLSDFVPFSSTEEINSLSPCWLCIPPSTLNIQSLPAGLWRPVMGRRELEQISIWERYLWPDLIKQKRWKCGWWRLTLPIYFITFTKL